MNTTYNVILVSNFYWILDIKNYNSIYQKKNYNSVSQIIKNKRMLTNVPGAMVKYLKQISFYEKVV